MSTLTTSRPLDGGKPRLTFGTTVAAEWKKLFTVRSTVYAAVLTVVIAAGFALLIAAVEGSLPADPQQIADTKAHAAEALGPSLVAGISFSQLVVGILAVLIVTSEYSTGLIQTTLATNPRRLSVLAAKSIVAVVTAIVLGAVSWGASAAVALPIYASQGLTAPLTDRWIIGGLGTMVIFLVIVSLFAVFLGTIVRNNAAGIATVAGVLFVLPILSTFVPQSVHIGRYLLPTAAQTLSSATYLPTSTTDVVTALVTTVVWLAVAGAVAALLLKKRDV